MSIENAEFWLLTSEKCEFSSGDTFLSCGAENYPLAALSPHHYHHPTAQIIDGM